MFAKMAEITVSVRAYCKMLLHAAKYPHQAINGLVLADTKKHQNTKIVHYVDCIPLFHINLGLAPMLEIALMQIDQYCKKHGLFIAGYYQANEHLYDSAPNDIARRITDKIQHNCKDASLLMIDNELMSPECEKPVYHLYRCYEGKWKDADQMVTLEEEALPAASSMVKSKAYRQLIDFDNHLDDISLDWNNTHINEMLKHLS